MYAIFLEIYFIFSLIPCIQNSLQNIAFGWFWFKIDHPVVVVVVVIVQCVKYIQNPSNSSYNCNNNLVNLSQTTYVLYTTKWSLKVFKPQIQYNYIVGGKQEEYIFRLQRVGTAVIGGVCSSFSKTFQAPKGFWGLQDF